MSYTLLCVNDASGQARDGRLTILCNYGITAGASPQRELQS